MRRAVKPALVWGFFSCAAAMARVYAEIEVSALPYPPKHPTNSEADLGFRRCIHTIA